MSSNDILIFSNWLADLDALHAVKSESQANVIKHNGIYAVIWNINKQTKLFLVYVKQVIGPHKFEIEHLKGCHAS